MTARRIGHGGSLRRRDSARRTLNVAAPTVSFNPDGVSRFLGPEPAVEAGGAVVEGEHCKLISQGLVDALEEQIAQVGPTVHTVDELPAA